MAATYRTSALILYHADHREADKRLDVFTCDHGLLTVIARGTRKIRSKLSGTLEPLTRSHLTLAAGRGSDVVMGSEVDDYFTGLKTNPVLTWLAMYIAESLRKFLHQHQGDRQLYHDVRRSFELLNRPDLSRDRQCLIADAVVWKLIAQSGLRPELYQCALCGKSLSKGEQQFAYAHGGTINPEHHHSQQARTVQQDTVTLLRQYEKQSLDQLQNLKVPDTIIEETHRMIIDGLAFHADEPVHSRSFVSPLFARAV